MVFLKKPTSGVFLSLLCVSTLLSAQNKLFVSPLGSDSNSGIEEEPLATLNGARDVIRHHKQIAKKNQSYTVIIKSGYYTMQEPFVLNEEDSGTEECPIIYKAEKGAKPVFSGGKQVTDFIENSEGVWQTNLPESSYYGWRFDQLYVNGKRATLARTPNKDFFAIDSVTQTIWKQGKSRVAEKAEQRLYFESEAFKTLLTVEEEIQNIHIKAYHKWDFTLQFIDGIVQDSLEIITSGKGMKPWNELKKGRRVVFENYAAALDEPGEWFLDNKGVLSYMPLEGETLGNTTIVAPVLGNLVTIKGNIKEDKYVHDVKLQGLAFINCHYEIPPTGSEPTQAATHLNAAIYTEGVKRIEVNHCEVFNIGQHAIWLGKGSSYSKIQHNYLHDLGGGGVYLGSFKAEGDKNHCHHLEVDNNVIQHGGREFPTAVGVWVGHSSDSQITHNDIGDFYYTGISVGWVWGYKPSLAKRNTIGFNHIHHIGWDLLSDMAGIYTLGASEGTTVEGNKVHHVHAYSYGGWGLYADEGSTGITFKNNLVYNTKTGGFQQNYGKDNVVENNILAFAHKYQMQCTVPEKHQSFTFTNNIILFKEGMVAKGAWDKVNAHLDHNVYWNIDGSNYDFNGNDFEVWKKIGFDSHSLLTNPGFENAANGDYTFKSKKAIKAIGFMPFDYSEAGVYGDKEWKQKAVLTQTIKDDFDGVVEGNLKQNIKR